MLVRLDRVSRPRRAHHRARPPRAAAGTWTGSAAGSRIPIARRPQAAWTLVPDFRQALAEVQEGAGTMLVTGSFHTVGDVMAALGMEP